MLIKSNIPWQAKALAQNIKNGNVNFDRTLSTPTNQWNAERKSQLIHSMISSYPIPALCFHKLKNRTYDCIDGKQRIEAIIEFMNGEYALHENFSPILIIDADSGTVHEFAGHKFHDLPQWAKNAVDAYTMIIDCYEDLTEEQFADIYHSLNSGTPEAQPEYALTIDQEFESLIPPLSQEEYQQLEQNILADGCREALIIWDGILIDGHNRYKICTQHGITYAVENMPFDSREAAKLWIVHNQLGRRNLTQEQMSYFRGQQYLMEKSQQGGTGANQYTVQKVQNAPSAKSQTTAQRHAEQHNVSQDTIKREAKRATVIDRIGAVSPTSKDKYLQGKANISKKELETLHDAPDYEIETVAKAIDEGTYVQAKKKTTPKESTSSNKNSQADSPPEQTTQDDSSTSTNEWLETLGKGLEKLLESGNDEQIEDILMKMMAMIHKALGVLQSRKASSDDEDEYEEDLPKYEETLIMNYPGIGEINVRALTQDDITPGLVDAVVPHSGQISGYTERKREALQIYCEAPADKIDMLWRWHVNDYSMA